MDAEIEFLRLLIKTCRATRTTSNPKNRVELAVPAAQWEMKFDARIAELQRKSGKSEPDPVNA